MRVGLMFFVLYLCLTPLRGEVRELGALVFDNVPDIPAVMTERVRQYQNTRSATFQDWLPNNEGMLISTRFGDTSQFHIVESPLKYRRQITFYHEPARFGSCRPGKGDPGFLFSKDIGGNEYQQIFFYSFKTRSARMLTDGVSLNSGAIWSHRGDRFAYVSTQRNQRDFDVYIRGIKTADVPRCVLAKGGYWIPLDWSGDDGYLLVARMISANHSELYVLNLKGGDLLPLHPPRKKIFIGGAAFGRHPQEVLYLSDQKGNFRQLWSFHLKTKKRSILIPSYLWDIDQFILSKNRQYLAYLLNANGMTHLHLLSVNSMQEIPLPTLPQGVVRGISFSSDSKRLAMTCVTPTFPGDIFVFDIGGGKITRWTESELGGLDLHQLVQPQLISYPTFDKKGSKPRQLSAFMYIPKDSDKPCPVVVDIHGGPEGQEMATYSSTIQFLVNELGICVIAPNVRGSAGYGKEFLKLDNGYLRENSVKDIGALLDWIETRKDLDFKRVAVMGGSYGGYMVLASMVHFNDRLACGIDYVGISNFVTFLKNTKSYRRDLRRVEYGDERDPKMKRFLEKISPLNHAHKITKPLFVVHGLNDPRVPQSEADQIVKKVREKGTEVWMLVAKNEGHGFRKKQNKTILMAAISMFLETFLL